ncbi:MAG: hypothetical protein HOW73_49620 [Polyangiaceae bacterium]|nr:hypothetical protein [Polyangiaceae bacterium]
MSAHPDHTNAATSLRAVGGEPLPSSLAGDLRALGDLPERARERFDEVLTPCLEPTLADDTDRAIESFCRRHDAIGNRVAAALRGARFLIWEAAKNDASAADIESDLSEIVPEHVAAVQAVIGPAYRASRDRIRAELVRRTVSDHGALLVGVDWRLDRIVASQHARNIDSHVAVLTLAYREGSETKRLSIQCDASMLQRLRAACDAAKRGNG